MVGPAKAMGLGIGVFAMLIGSVVFMTVPKLAGMAGVALPGADMLRAAGDNKAAVSRIAELAKKNNEMTEVMRQQTNQEAQEIIARYLEEGAACQQIGLLKEICSNNILKLESCSDPRVAALV